MKQFCLSTATAMLAAQANAGAITKVFQEPVAVTGTSAGATVNYGTLEGRTSWDRNGYGADASLNLAVEIIAKGPSPTVAGTAPNDLWLNYHYELVISDPETTVTGSEFISSKAGAGTDAVEVGNNSARVEAINYSVGKTWPSGRTSSSTFSYSFNDAINSVTL